VEAAAPDIDEFYRIGPPMDYRDAGVDIPAADDAKARIKALARRTFNASVMTEIGSFGGMFRPDFTRYREPVLVASTDGVGTKIQVARQAGVHDTVGYDLVAHCVNDILVQGAVPLFFLDYIALGTWPASRAAARSSAVRSWAGRRPRCRGHTRPATTISRGSSWAWSRGSERSPARA
jgi:phosphoribosylaminoimidazole (AIR) synthetase